MDSHLNTAVSRERRRKAWLPREIIALEIGILQNFTRDQIKQMPELQQRTSKQLNSFITSRQKRLKEAESKIKCCVFSYPCFDFEVLFKSYQTNGVVSEHRCNLSVDNTILNRFYTLFVKEKFKLWLVLLYLRNEYSVSTYDVLCELWYRYDSFKTQQQ